MNRIELRPRAGVAPGGTAVQVLIDGRDLIDRVRTVELSQAAAEGQAGVAGTYEGLEPFQWADLPESGEDGRVAVLGCACGEVGCWPLRVRITRGEGTVTWSDFEQPFRSWSYEGLGPFVFDAGEYDRAVAAVAKQMP